MFYSVPLADFGIGMETVLAVAGIGQEQMMFVVRNYGLFLLNVRTGETQKLKCPPFPSLLSLDSDKNIYVNAEGGIYAYNLSNQSWHLVISGKGKSFDGYGVR